MKIAIVSLLALAGSALAVPTATIQKRADYCGQWDSTVTGTYTIYNNLWGRDAATSGSQCTGVDSLSGTTVAWHTKWSWAGGPYNVKSYANAVVKFTPKALSAISKMPTTWKWTYTGTSLIANVAYDLFFSSTATGSAQYELMVWVGALGGAGPISATGSPIATTTINGVSWKLYKGVNGQMTVFSFVASSNAQSFSGDLINFTNYLVKNQGLPKSQILQSIGAGTEPFTGSNAVFKTSAYSVTVS